MKATNERLDRAGHALAGKHVGGEREEFDAANEEVLDAERTLARELSEPFAAPLAFPLEWDIGAPLPHLLQSDHQTLLLFLISEPDPDWDGTYVREVGPSSKGRIGIVEFKHCVSTRFGSPNDEVFHGHPLTGRGLRAYTAMEIHNSGWIEELRKISSVHHHYRPDSARSARHFLFGFHDSTFECVASGFEVSTADGSITDALINLAKRIG